MDQVTLNYNAVPATFVVTVHAETGLCMHMIGEVVVHTINTHTRMAKSKITYLVPHEAVKVSQNSPCPG